MAVGWFLRVIPFAGDPRSLLRSGIFASENRRPPRVRLAWLVAMVCCSDAAAGVTGAVARALATRHDDCALHG